MHHLDAARGLSPDEVTPRGRANLTRAANNLAIAHAAVLAHRAEIDATGLPVDWRAIERDGDLPAALTWAEVPTHDTADLTLAEETATFLQSAQVLAADARTMALRRALPAARVSAVLRRRKGPVQIAHATVALVALYRDHAELLRGRTSMSSAELAELSRDASNLLPQLDQGAARAHSARLSAAARRDLIDRVWTLAVRHHRTLGRIAGALWGTDARTHVPSLLAGGRRRRGAPPTPSTP